MGLKNLISDTKTQYVKKEINPIELFNFGNRKPAYAYLRENQQEFLSLWNQRRDKKDIVGILNTGAGKTLIGLLMLKSKMYENNLPAIYLCPTVQLVDQVYNQAINYGIQVCKVDEDWENDFFNAEKILIATFDKMFNGKSIFGVKGFSTPKQIGSIVIDDAHACIKSARKQCTITIPRNNNYYDIFLNLFSSDLKWQSEGKYNAILNGENSVCSQVSYWSWIDNIDTVKKQLADLVASSNNYIFNYRMVSDILDYCQCYISGQKIEITPRNIPVEQIPSFSDAKHRFILSATLNNEDLCSELNIDEDAICNPIITTHSTTDIGERLIIAPTKYHNEITDDYIRQELITYSKKTKQNIIVIVPNSYLGKIWQSHGAEITDSHSIIDILNSLDTTLGRTIVLVNRYDGIDIPENLSHILVLDSLPNFSTNREKIISTDNSSFNWYASQMAQKIEQGLGRTVRSVTDYSVVILLGDTLCNFVGRNEYLQYFSPALQNQLELSKQLRDEIFETKEEALKEINYSIGLCLNRDPEWMQWSKEYLKKIIPKNFNEADFLSYVNEQNIYRLISNKKLSEAESKLSEIINIEKNKEKKARYLQLLAEIKYDTSIEESNNLQVKSYESGAWHNSFKPRMSEIKKKIKGSTDQIQSSLYAIKDFNSSHEFKLYMDDIIKHLVYSNDSDSEKFEDAVEKLGNILGFDSTRPEKLWIDGGPDNLWCVNNFVILIECKNRRTQDRIIKGDIEQLLSSDLWFTNTHHMQNSNYYKVICHKSSRVAHDAPLITENGFSLTMDKLQLLKNKLNYFKDSIIQIGIEKLDINNIDHLLRINRLEMSEFCKNFLEQLRK